MVKNDIKMVVNGILKGMIFSLVAVLVFSFVVQLFSPGDNVIHVVDQFIKSLAVFIGCFFSLKGRFGWLKGALTGLFVFLLTYLIFALVAGAQVFSVSFLIDAAFGLAVGLISGVIAVNVRKEN